MRASVDGTLFRRVEAVLVDTTRQVGVRRVAGWVAPATGAVLAITVERRADAALFAEDSRVSARRDGARVVLQFDHPGSGLQARADKYGYLRGFALADAAGTFHWARAHVSGDTVVVHHPDIAEPTAVRYAWADNPDDANLYNAEGFPAAPFRAEVE